MIEAKEYENQLNASNYLFEVVGGLALLLLGPLLYLFLETPTYKPYPAIWVMSGLAVICFIIPIYRNRIMRPSNIMIDGSGLLLRYRSGKTRLIRWSSMHSVVIVHEPGSGSYKKGRAGLYLKNETFFVDMTPEIANHTLDAYAEATGKMLPKRESTA